MRMGIKYSNKINKIRTFALSLVFIGLLIAYLGVFFPRKHYYYDYLYDAWFLSRSS